MPVYQIDGLTPVIDPSSYVHPTAVLIGDVIVGKRFISAPTPACAATLAGW
jgi:phenylacetic acid degradation protein